MRKFHINLSIPLLTILALICFKTPAYSSNEIDTTIHQQITFTLLSKEDSPKIEYKNLFVATFSDNYSDLQVTQLKPHFTKQEDVIKWLEATFDEEWEYFKTANHPVDIIEICIDKRLSGIAFIEISEPETLHLRQMAILPSDQRKGYSTTLLNSIHNILKGQTFNRIVADTRKLNSKALAFYAKNNFEIMAQPYDPALRESGKYVGLEKKNLN